MVKAVMFYDMAYFDVANAAPILRMDVSAAAGIAAVPDSYREPMMRLMFFVGGRRLTKEAHVPLTKTQTKQGNYKRKALKPPKEKSLDRSLSFFTDLH